ncbi:hypothetical protein COLINT_02151 [Collinsella intestinalis DSM 13280]|uniref:Uncharacterized protein n=1 Tax=Collinsella intestinalis DSM 13280 TaxID=521003 RepID=C4F7Y6_9ACTN|nr:hypothetical protein COLINT_02151 [Collinsella intestinalis DSM 13280]
MPRCHSVAILDHFLLQIGVFLVAICHFGTAQHIATTLRRPAKRRRVLDIAWGGSSQSKRGGPTNRSGA